MLKTDICHHVVVARLREDVKGSGTQTFLSLCRSMCDASGEINSDIKVSDDSVRLLGCSLAQPLVLLFAHSSISSVYPD